MGNIILHSGQYFTPLLRILGLISLILPSGAPQAADSWDVEGANGVLYVYGTLTESACRLEMDSLRQDIRLEDTGTGRLHHKGDSGTPVMFRIGFKDCIRSDTVTDERTGKEIGAYHQPIVSVRFSGPRDVNSPELFSLNGVSGLGLRIADKTGNDIRAGSRGVPLVLDRGQDSLYYTVAAVRTSDPLVAGNFYAAVDFNLSYD